MNRTIRIHYHIKDKGHIVFVDSINMAGDLIENLDNEFKDDFFLDSVTFPYSHIALQEMVQKNK